MNDVAVGAGARSGNSMNRKRQQVDLHRKENRATNRNLEKDSKQSS